MNDYHLDVERLPAVILHNGSVLYSPTIVEVAAAIGVHTNPSRDLYDVALVGAGPAGLAAGVYGASEGLRTIVMECESIGGQAGSSSLIRNYLGFPRGLSGDELTSEPGNRCCCSEHSSRSPNLQQDSWRAAKSA